MAVDLGLKCQWSVTTSPGEHEPCGKTATTSVLVPVALGVYAYVNFCRNHSADYKRRSAEARILRKSSGVR